MIATIHTCANCGSAEIFRNGHSGSNALYQCIARGYQAPFVPAAVAKAAQYAQAESVLRHSQRSIACVTGVARISIVKRLKKRPRPRRSCLDYARKRSSARSGKSWNLISYGAL